MSKYTLDSIEVDEYRKFDDFGTLSISFKILVDFNDYECYTDLFTGTISKTPWVVQNDIVRSIPIILLLKYE